MSDPFISFRFHTLYGVLWRSEGGHLIDHETRAMLFCGADKAWRVILPSGRVVTTGLNLAEAAFRYAEAAQSGDFIPI